MQRNHDTSFGTTPTKVSVEATIDGKRGLGETTLVRLMLIFCFLIRPAADEAGNCWKQSVKWQRKMNCETTSRILGGVMDWSI